ncbi:class I SAM-dependent methyltransferase [Hyphococcus sp.]|uniref:class I SAM-dependent methyltransferase n=1 Tax=Hyphococcus sp. TaxID=2038636 RepID=UPI003CCBA9A0
MAGMNAPPQMFDRRLYAARRARAAKQFSDFDFLHRRAMEDIADRLETVMRDFPRAVFSGAGDITALLTPKCGVGDIAHMDLAPERLPAAGLSVGGDEERLPFRDESLDLFISLLTLHAANDVVGALAQIRKALKPDGLFIAAAFGEETLGNLKRALFQAESEMTGGVSARIAPFAGVQNFGQALSRAGFALPVVDIDKVRVRYDEPVKLLRDLKGMGETQALASRTAPLRRDVLMRAMSLFSENGGEEQFDIIYLTGWAPHQSQQKPLAPGSAKFSLEKAVKDGG